MPRIRRRARLDPSERRAQLIDIAYELMLRAEQGPGAITIENVADAAGVSRSLVYTYFGDRDGLVAEVYLRVVGELNGALQPPLPRDKAGLAELITACMRFARRQPAAWQLLATDSVRRHPVVSEARHRQVEDLARLGDASGDGSGYRLLADAVLGLLEAGVLHWLERSDLSEDAAADMLADMLWRGLGGIPTR